MGSVPSPELTAYIANHLNLDTQLRELEQQQSALEQQQQQLALEQQQQHYYFSLKVIVALGVSLAATIIGALILASIIIPPVAATAIGVVLLAGGIAGITAAGFFAKSSYDNSTAAEIVHGLAAT